MGMERMSGSKLGLFLFLLFFFCVKLCYCIIVCPEIEKLALLNFKQSLEDPYNMLSSWNISREENCCMWRGVVCSNLTGHVHQLHLQGPSDSFEGGLRGRVNPSLLSLKELKYLDLSQNEFGVKIPSLIGLLTSLEYLNLSFAGFHGKIPHDIGNLSNLHTLSLGGYEWREAGLVDDNIEWLSGLSRLEYLNMNEVNLSKATNWVQVINTVPSLVHLHLSDCSLSSLPQFLSHLNTTSLAELDLSGNIFHSSVMPIWIFQLPSLVELYLGYCNFKAPLTLSHVNTTSLATLDLSGNIFHSSVMPIWIFQLPSLVELYLGYCNFKAPLTLSHVNTTSLATLDLSGNDFSSFVMPPWIFQQPNLIFLYLSDCGFEGPIPSISNTTKLRHIDLSFNNFNSSLPDWLYFCKHLENIQIRYSKLYGKISKAIGNLTSLYTLNLYSNELSGNIPSEIASLCKIQELQLSFNHLQGDVSDSFGNMSECFLESVTSLSLSENQLSGHLTSQFGEFKSLEILHLDGNSISGAIPINIGNLSSLIILVLANSNLSGKLPESLWHLHNLWHLDIGYNQLSGNLPESLGHLHNLRYLDIGYNQLSGNLPESLGQLYNLENLIIGNNMLQGTVTETHFSNLSNLMQLSASGNHLSLKVSSDWVPPFEHLNKLELRSWDLGVDHIPLWIETLKSRIDYLDLSNTGISGNIPTWLLDDHNRFRGRRVAEVTISYSALDFGRSVCLSSNQFSGSLPRIGNDVGFLDLSNNSFTTGLSQLLCNTTDESNSLEVLLLGGNKLIGELSDCLMKWPSLKVLSLASNNLFGNIPNSIGFLEKLSSLDLHGNKFSGQIPFSMQNCTQLVKVDLGGNDLSGNIPPWIGKSLKNLKFLILRSNKLSGEIPSYICHLNALQILDLSNNTFSGVIPNCVDNFTAMSTKRSLDTDFEEIRIIDPRFQMTFMESASVGTKGREYGYDTILSLVTNIDLSNNNLSGSIPKELTSLVELGSLNFSGNRLTGYLPNSMGDMKQLESLDLSRNSLSGEIPNSFALMSTLSYLDLSFNNLTGMIPSSTQLQSMNPSSFAGNHLCGPPLPNNCSNVDPHVDVKEDDESKVEWLYVFLSLGYAIGFSAFCTALILKKPWRDAYFGILECIWNKLYVYFCIKWRWLTITAQAPTS